MLADQFLEAADDARTAVALDDLARKLWRAHAEGHLADAEAEAVSAAIEARRAAWRAGPCPRAGSRPGASQGLPAPGEDVRPRPPRALDRNAKVRIMHWARCLSRRTEKGRAYGVVTAKALAVLEALLWAFHNAKSGLCFPSYETIAEAAHCARSTVAGALRALEEAGVLSWVHRLKRVREPCPDLLGDNGWRWRVLRTSNSYAFTDPSPAADRPNSSKSEYPDWNTEPSLFFFLRGRLRRRKDRPFRPERGFARGRTARSAP